MTADSRTQLPPQYTPGDVEARRYQDWVASGLFGADPAAPGPAYCIVIPPPNVTGSLHMGHALDHTLMDALIRRRRMQGYVTLWLPGMDHAGIATQNVVERVAHVQGAGHVRRRDHDAVGRPRRARVGVEQPARYPVLVTASLHVAGRVLGR